MLARRARALALTAEGCSTVLVASGGASIGVIGVADEPREAAREAVELLREQGIEHVVLLTGDHERAARARWRRTSASTSTAPALLPEDKVAAVEDAARGATARWRWSATASTTRRRSRPPMSASRWASRAPTPRSRPPTSR